MLAHWRPCARRPGALKALPVEDVPKEPGARLQASSSPRKRYASSAAARARRCLASLRAAAQGPLEPRRRRSSGFCCVSPQVAPWAWALRTQLVILTGGNDAPGTGQDAVPARNEAESLLLSLAARTGTPVLGVCRGAQMLALAAGMRLTRVEGHVRVRHALTGPLAGAWRGPAEVASFHHWGVEEASMPAGWDVLARSETGGMEAFASRARRALGILWHPEREPHHLPAVLEYLEAHTP